MKFSAATALATTALFLTLAACGQPEATTPEPSAPETTVTETPAAETPAAETPAAKTVAETETPAPEVTPAAAPAAEPAAATDFAGLPAPYNTADLAKGKRTWKLCQSCHLTKEGAGHLVGPNLHGIFGHEAGTAEGFAYSDALKAADFTWTPDQLDHWLENPNSFLPGNRMTFAGVRRPEDRIAVIAYLMTETGYSAPEGEGE